MSSVTAVDAGSRTVLIAAESEGRPVWRSSPQTCGLGRTPQALVPTSLALRTVLCLTSVKTTASGSWGIGRYQLLGGAACLPLHAVQI